MQFPHRRFDPILVSMLAALALGWAGPALGAPQQESSAQSADDDEASDEEERTYSRFYTGAFHEYSLRGGPSLVDEVDYAGWHLDAGMRHSFPFLLGDFRVAYRFDNLSAGNDRLPDTLEQHSVGGYLALHPLYLLLLGSDWLSYTLASLHLELGIGAQFAVLEIGSDSEDARFETDFSPFYTVGGGFDVPLWDTDEGAAPWLNVVYRWRMADVERPSSELDVDMHTIQVGLGWRINGLLF